jgi:hypothetical protein
MNRVDHLKFKRVLTLVPVAVLGFAAFLNVGGCSSNDPTTGTSGGTGGTGPVASGGSGGTVASGSGGTVAASGSGGTVAASGSGGTVAASGSGGTVAAAGTSGSAGGAAMRAIPTLSDCPDIVTPLKTCSKIGCHQGQFAQANLNLIPDMGLVGRLKDVTASHAGIVCSNNLECVPTSCPPNVKLVDSSNAQNSWMMTKLEGSQADCGTAMPPPTEPVLDANSKACIESLIKAIAALPP